VTREIPAAVESPAAIDPRLFAELFASLASLLRSYTTMHGLQMEREAAVELTEETITVRHGEKWLRLTRNHAILTWMRENESMGTLELTETGTLRSATSEEAMDMAAEQWAREIMQ
jgi:cell division inhibitor SulA